VACPQVKTLPSLSDLIESSRPLGERIRDVSIADLLGRAPVKLDQTRIREEISGRVVLVTGAGGSIGSELCRQAASYGPKRLICLDHAESDLYRIDLELRRTHPKLEIVPFVGDIRDPERVDEAFAGRGIDVVFHAAAYKHVPMMEAQPIEVVTTNVFGTWNLAQAAQRHGVPNFVMISSDKAVNPTNVMGLTKRTAELLVASRETDPGNRTKFVSVRFGNVLGSNGSVVPLFQQQIAAGGPVTVTDARMTRYFMTIPEAVQLVLQASVLGERSEIFVLDMGEPVKIVDLARNMIRLAGLVPDRDIAIEYVGLRDGEKLYEELITEGEDIVPTGHEKIKVFRGPAVEASRMEQWLAELRWAVSSRSEEAIVAHLAGLVPEYMPGPRWSRSTEARLSPAQRPVGKALAARA
jgi:FlaA1/EpsC-like NDP-sugar epimerase